ncbi:MAG TPA: hypothetical protein VFL72_00170 [Acidimicrobiia bacterium]|nr:hypothetical protein [Acidimicrobiia bacterium]
MTTSEVPPTTEPSPSDPVAGGRGRRIVTGLLVVVTSASVVVAAIGVWAHNVLLDTDQFMETVEPALQTPALYTALGDRVSAQVLEALDLETRIAASLTQLDDFLFEALVDALEIGDRGQALLDSFNRPSLDDLAPTLTSGLEDRITARIDNFMSSPDLQARVPELARRAHQATVALLRGDLEQIPNVSIQDGEVTLNAIPIIGEAIRRALPDLSGLGPEINLPDRFSDRIDEARQQLAAAIGARLPEDFGQLTIMSEDRLTELQDGVILLDRMMWGLLAFAVILLVVTLVISRTRRRTAIQLAIGVVIALLLAEATLRWVQRQIVEAIADPTDQEVAVDIVGNVFAGLRQGALLIGIAALVLGFAAYLSGRPAWAMRVKDRVDHVVAQGPGGSLADRWVSEHYDLVRAVGIGIAVVAIYLIGISLASVLIVGALLGLLLWGVSEMRKRAETPVDEAISV